MPQSNSLFQYSGKYFSAYKSYPVDKASFDQFLKDLKDYLQALGQLKPNANESTFVKCLSDFLTTAFKYKTVVGYKGSKSKGGSSIDLVTVEGNSVKTIVEAKTLGKLTELYSITGTGLDINKKALHETIYYFYAHIEELERQRLSNVLLTDTMHFIFVDPKSFVHKGFKKICDDFMEGRLILNSTSNLYDSDLKPFIEKKHIDFDFVEFDLNKYEKKLQNNSLNESDLRDLRNFYKLLHPNFLHKEFKPRDANKLNSKFYQELLYIFGLEEKKQLIVPREGKSTIYHQITKRQEKENQDEAISLISIWMNRILFLKLFETQLYEFNGKNKEFKFFSSSKIGNGYDLNTLFFHILNTPVKDRIPKDQQPEIPYLNSSLFEKKTLENILTIAEVLNEPKQLYDKTSLKNIKNKNPTFVQYLLDFLDAYSFNETDEETDKETGEIISSSVLGLVFEKLNGYKDGSFFTPASITEFLTKEVIDRVVLDKFNPLFPDREPAENIGELKKLIERNSHKDGKREEYIRKFNEIKILDPACGSGHFLVSALNYLIYLKSYLELTPFCNHIEIHNDSLVIFNKEGTGVFKYKRNDEASRLIQQQIFDEKANVIRNSLFGCDLNPMSVEICRLRLWIELLKNAYYKKTDGEKIGGEMEVLPNIDINIKVGDALSTSFWRRGDTNLYATPKQLSDYKKLVDDYKAGQYETTKHDLLKNIKEQRAFLKEPLAYTDKLDNAILWEIDFPEILNTNGGFEGFDIVIGNPPYIPLQNDGGYLRNKYQGLGYLTLSSNGDIYQLFYEQGWHLLKDSGYLCFITSNKWMRAKYGKDTRQFLSGNLKLDDNKNTPIHVDLQLLLDLTKSKIFENATVDTNILIFKKSPKKNGATTKCKTITDVKDLESPISSCVDISFPPDEPWSIISPIEQSIKQKIKSVGTPLKDWDVQINRGILTGCNDAFIIKTEQRKEILANCKDEAERARTEELIQPILRGRDIKRYANDWADLWLIASFPTKHYDIDQYPAVKSYLLSFSDSYLREAGLDWVADNFLAEFCKQKLSQSGQSIKINGQQIKINNREEKSRRKSSSKWFEIQDNINYWKNFGKPKVVWKRIGSIIRFSYDNKGYLSLDSTCLMTGENIPFLVCLLNSPMGHYLLKNAPTTGTGDLLISVQAVEPLLVPKPKDVSIFENFLHEIEQNPSASDVEINSAIYQLYGLDSDEINFIESL